MVFYNLTIGSFKIKYTPLNPRVIDFPYCDKDGNILKRVVEGKGKAVFINEQTGERHEQAFKLIKDKPVSKLSKTKEVSKYKEVDLNEVYDLITEKEYYVESDILLQELKETGKAVKFGFTFGNGFKVYKAYVYVNPLYNCLFMSVGTTQKSEVLQELREIQTQKKKSEEISLVVQGIERAKVEDLIEI